MKTIKVSSPWVQYVNELNAMFSRDKEIKIVFDNDKPEVKLLVEDSSKADALAKILPASKDFGNVMLKITVIPANTEDSIAMRYAKAFKGNPVLKDMITISDAFTNPLTYLVFEKKVVQYFDDDLSDPHGQKSTLYQNIANDIFDNHDGVLFCTSNTKNEFEAF